jgi:hypothetical protein
LESGCLGTEYEEEFRWLLYADISHVTVDRNLLGQMEPRQLDTVVSARAVSACGIVNPRIKAPPGSTDAYARSDECSNPQKNPGNQQHW